MSQLKICYLTRLVVCLRNYTLGATVDATGVFFLMSQLMALLGS